jgi:hypothetical protein
LRRQLAELHHDTRFISGEVTDHIKRIYNYLKVLDDRTIANQTIHQELIFKLFDMVEPLEEKFFPAVSAMCDQLYAVRKKPEHGSGDDADHKKT